MECFYFSALTNDTTSFILPADEAKHLKALRIKENEKFYVTNGHGLKAICLIKNFNKNGNLINIIDFVNPTSKKKNKIDLALSILDNRERLEFAVEKAGELGISSFIPFVSAYSQTKSVNLLRLRSKAIAAMKQSLSENIMNVESSINFNDLLELAANYSQIILCDENGSKPSISKDSDSILILVGPEGGFSGEELAAIKKLNNCHSWSLGSSRLRAETAAICAAGIAVIL